MTSQTVSTVAKKSNIQTEVVGDLKTVYNHLEKLNSLKRDVVTPAKNLIFKHGVLSMFNSESGDIFEMDINRHARTQMFQKLGIPIEYANRCTQDILEKNVNGWLKEMASTDKSFMLRTFTEEKEFGLCRAFLSNRYKVIDNFDMLAIILELVAKAKQETGYDIKAVKNSVTDSNMYLRFVAPEIESHEKIMEMYKDPLTGNKDTGIVTGFVFKNSETGGGKFSLAPRIVFGACSNGAIFADEAINMVHLGGSLEDGNYSNQTLNLQMQTIMSGAKDQLDKWLSKEWLGQKISMLKDASEVVIKNPLDTIVNIGDQLRFSKERTKDLINAFMGGGDNSALGIFHALTFEAQHNGDEDERFLMEAKAVKLLPEIKDFDRKANVKKMNEVMNLN